ncbi:hypothetical protein HDU79_009557 [Rhizoclosmatium sp. JEL0117]|nr:hypothetical protein HDU79_009557 [Rhizoclosmatium sp. JEL0117]
MQSVIRLAFANPRIRENLHVLPVMSDSVSELFHSNKWIDKHPTPMVRNNLFDYFSGEAYYTSKEWEIFVPTTFVENSTGTIVAMGMLGCFIEIETVKVENSIDVQIDLNSLGERVTSIVHVIHDGTLDPETLTSIKSGSLMRAKANGKRVYNVPITLFNDDTSGNVSKKWNKYESWEFSLAGLPFHLTQRLENIFFVCTSKTLSAVESGAVICTCMKELRNGIVVRDCLLNEDVLVIGLYAIQILGDNPSHSAIVSHTGVTSHFPCRICEITKPNSVESLISYLCDPSPMVGLRSFNHIKKQLAEARYDILHSETTPAAAGARIVKYAIRATIEGLTTEEKQVLKARVDGTSQKEFVTHLHGHSAVQYVKSMNGKDFRTWVQIAPFALSTVITEEELEMWTCLSSLTAYLYCSEISNFENYIHNLKGRLDQFVLAAAKTKYFPVFVKPKLHLLRHIIYFIETIGPGRLYATEVFESFNKVIRMCIYHTTRLNPSRDVALQFANYMCLNHIADGGLFKVDGEFLSNTNFQSYCRSTSSISVDKFRLDAFVVICGEPRIFMKIVNVDSKHERLSGLQYVLMNGVQFVSCPVLEPTLTVVHCTFASAALINVQHLCDNFCKVTTKRNFDATKHDSILSHVGAKVVINLFSFHTQKLVFDLVADVAVVEAADMEAALTEGYEVWEESKKPKVKGKGKGKAKGKGKQKSSVNDDSDYEE